MPAESGPRQTSTDLDRRERLMSFVYKHDTKKRSGASLIRVRKHAGEILLNYLAYGEQLDPPVQQATISDKSWVETEGERWLDMPLPATESVFNVLSELRTRLPGIETEDADILRRQIVYCIGKAVTDHQELGLQAMRERMLQQLILEVPTEQNPET